MHANRSANHTRGTAITNACFALCSNIHKYEDEEDPMELIDMLRDAGADRSRLVESAALLEITGLYFIVLGR